MSQPGASGPGQSGTITILEIRVLSCFRDKLSGTRRPTSSTRQTGHYYGQQRYGVVRERGDQNCSCPIDRGRSEEVKELRSRLMWVASLLARAMVMSGPRLLLGLMSGFMVLMQP